MNSQSDTRENLGFRQGGTHIAKVVLYAKKVGMISMFLDKWDFIGCTVLEVPKHCLVKEVYQDVSSGLVKYKKIQFGVVCAENPGSFSVSKKVKKPLKVDLEKKGVLPCYRVFESANPNGMFDTLQNGAFIVASDVFKKDMKIGATSKSKGKGFQGVIKRHNMAGGPASHGSSKFHRKCGSVGGGRSTSGRTFKNSPMAGRMGFNQVTVWGLKVISVLKPEDMNLDPIVWQGYEWIIVHGAVPGSTGSSVFLSSKHVV